MAISNFSAATAMRIDTLPFYITVSAADIQSSPGLDHPLWFVFVNNDYLMINGYALGSLSGVLYPPGKTFNVPMIEMFTDDPGGGVVPYPIGFGQADQASLQIPSLTRPTTLYWKVSVASDGFNPTEPVSDPMTLRVLGGPRVTVQVGPTRKDASIMIPDDDPQWPSQVFGIDGNLKQTVNLAATENGYMFDDGTYAILPSGTVPFPLFLYTPQVVQYATVVIPGTTVNTGSVTSGDGVSTAFVGGLRTGGAGEAKVTAVDKVTGAVGSSWILPANSTNLQGMAPNRAKTILYYQALVGSVSNVRRYDLVGNVAMSDLAGNVAGFQSPRNLFVLKDGSILVGYTQVGASQFIRYDPSGAVLNTYTTPSDVTMNHFSPYVDDPASFLVWTFVRNAPYLLARFFVVDTETEEWTILGNDIPVFESGTFDGAVQFGDYVKEQAAFGLSSSCPVLVPRVPLIVDVPTLPIPTPCCGEPKVTDLGPVDRPVDTGNTGPVLPPIHPDWDAECSAGGLVPSQADPTDFEVWA